MDATIDKSHKLILLSFVCLVLTATQVFGQDKKPEFYITANGNLYLPGGDKGVYPILWYNKDQNPKFQVGGLGAGFTVFIPKTSKLTWKLQANISSHAYWSDPIILRDNANNALGDIVLKSIECDMALVPMIHYNLTPRWSAGTGLGVEVFLFAHYNLGNTNYFTYGDSQIVPNNRYASLTPVIPVEIGYRINRMLFNVRYEYGFLNRVRGDLSDYVSEHFQCIAFEVGYKIR